MAGQPLYTTVDSVMVRLANKVQFESPDGLLDGELPNKLLYQLISDAETMVELTLRARYKIPFQSIRTGHFSGLPDHSSRSIRILVDAKAAMLILATDFGSGAHVSADPYYKELKTVYKDQMLLVFGRDPEAANEKIDRFRKSPPLEDLALALTNLYGDNGYRGKVINTDGSHDGPVEYAEHQINDPSRTYIRRPGLGGV